MGKSGHEAGTARTPRRCYAGALIACPDFVLSELAVSVTDLLEEALSPLNLRVRHYRLLILLHEGPRPQSSLSAVLGVDRTTVVSLVDHLERLRLAKRERGEDRRKFFVHLTPKGEKVLETALKRVRDTEERIFAPLAPSQRDLLRDAATRLLAEGPIGERARDS